MGRNIRLEFWSISPIIWCSDIVKPKPKTQIQNINSDNQGRRISIDIEIKSETYQILNIYAPNKQKYKENFLNETN